MSILPRRLGSPVSSFGLVRKGGRVRSPTKRSNAALLHVLTAAFGTQRPALSRLFSG
jgi:hypothetical protein